MAIPTISGPIISDPTGFENNHKETGTDMTNSDVLMAYLRVILGDHYSGTEALNLMIGTTYLSAVHRQSGHSNSRWNSCCGKEYDRIKWTGLKLRNVW